MKHYITIEVNLIDPTWVPEYIEVVTPIVISYGGRYLTRSSQIDMLEGTDKPQFLLIAEFPSKDAALGFYNCEAYRPYKEKRLAGAQCSMKLVPAEGVAG